MRVYKDYALGSYSCIKNGANLVHSNVILNGLGNNAERGNKLSSPNYQKPSHVTTFWMTRIKQR